MPPKDVYNLNYILFYCMGALAQLSSPIISNAQSYWKYKFRDTEVPWNPNENTTTTLQNEFTAHFTLAGGLPMILGLAFAVLYTRKWNMTYRLLGGFVIYITMFVVIIMFVLINTDSWQSGFLYMTLVFIALISWLNGSYLLSVLQLGSKLPPIFITGILSGNAVCGILASSLEILTLFVDGSPTTCGVIYFSITLGFIISTLIGFIALLNYSPFLQYHLQNEVTSENTNQETGFKFDKTLFMAVLKKQKYVLAAFLLVYIISGSIQPAVTATAKSVDAGNGSKWNDVFFPTVVTFFLYSLFDLMGREIGLRINWPKNNLALCALSFSRIVIVPLILMCNLTAKEHTSVVFKSDIIYIILIILFAFSNGYMTNNSIMAIHRNYDDPEAEKPIAIGLIAALVLLGTLLTSFVGLPLIKLI